MKKLFFVVVIITFLSTSVFSEEGSLIDVRSDQNASYREIKAARSGKYAFLASERVSRKSVGISITLTVFNCKAETYKLLVDEQDQGTASAEAIDNRNDKIIKNLNYYASMADDKVVYGSITYYKMKYVCN